MKKDSLQMKNGEDQIEVFYLLPPWPKALIEDDLDCPEELVFEDLNELAGFIEKEWQKQNTNENSADGDAHLCAPSVHGSSCCPVGEKGESGEIGMYEEELVIKKVLDALANSQLNMSSEAARIFLAKEIAKDLRAAGMLAHCPF